MINLQYPLGSYSIENPPSNETLKGDLSSIQVAVNAQEDEIAATAPQATTYTKTEVDAAVAAVNVKPKTNTVTTSANPTINTDTTDEFTITALSDVIASMTTNLSGTPVNGQRLIIRILDAGVAKGITWGAKFVSRGATLPTTTVQSKYTYVGLIFNSTANLWDCVATSQEV